jgi:hypothetical protein
VPQCPDGASLTILATVGPLWAAGQAVTETALSAGRSSAREQTFSWNGGAAVSPIVMCQWYATRNISGYHLAN